MEQPYDSTAGKIAVDHAPSPFDAPPQLDAGEVQLLKEMIARQLAAPTAPKLLQLPLTDLDRDRFAEHLWSGSVYDREFAAFGGRFKATLRVREKGEIDRVSQQLNEDYRDGLIQSAQQRADLAAAYNLRFQLTSLNGEEQNTKFPDPKSGPGRSAVTIPSLRQWTQDSPVHTFSEARLTVLLNWLAQFQDLVGRLTEEAVGANFTAPADAI